MFKGMFFFKKKEEEEEEKNIQIHFCQWECHQFEEFSTNKEQ